MSIVAVSGSDINDDFIKACRDGDLARFNDLVDRADVNYVSESGNQGGSRNSTIKVASKQSCNKDLRRFWRRVYDRLGTYIYQTTITLGQEPLSIIHYTRPGTCIICPLHWAWIQYQAAHLKLIGYTMPCKLACCLTRK